MTLADVGAGSNMLDADDLCELVDYCLSVHGSATSVIPAKAGIHAALTQLPPAVPIVDPFASLDAAWIPASAGMTGGISPSLVIFLYQRPRIVEQRFAVAALTADFL